MTAHVDAALPVSKRAATSHVEEADWERAAGHNHDSDDHTHGEVSHQIIDRLRGLNDPVAERAARIIFDCEERLANAITNCEEHGTPFRRGPCNHVLHARDAARIAIRNRRAAERALRSLPSGTKVAHVTLTSGSDDLAEGLTRVVKAFAALRRTAAWRRAVTGGLGQVEFLPGVGGSRRWNVHAHVMVWLSAEQADVHAIRASWRRLFAAKDLPASLTWTSVARRFVRGRRGETFLTGRVLRDQAQTIGASRVHGRAASRRRARGAGEAIGPPLRHDSENTNSTTEVTR